MARLTAKQAGTSDALETLKQKVAGALDEGPASAKELADRFGMEEFQIELRLKELTQEGAAHGRKSGLWWAGPKPDSSFERIYEKQVERQRRAR